MTSRVYIVVLIAIVGMAACRTADVPPGGAAMRQLHDDLGRSVRVPEKVDRAVSLAPSLTEMVFAAGAGNRLVGVTTFCNYPAEAAAIEKVGDTQTPNIERIIALRPQIVLVSTASQLEAFSRTLDEQGIAVYVTNPKSLDEVFANLKDLGDLFGVPDTAQQKIAELSERVKNVDARAEPGERTRIFVQVSNEPLFTIGKDSFLTELIGRAGGVSVTRDVLSGYPKLSKETAAALNPDVIILSDSEDNRDPNTVFKDSNAVREGRVYRINADILSRPGPRLVDALEQIAAKLQEGN